MWIRLPLAEFFETLCNQILFVDSGNENLFPFCLQLVMRYGSAPSIGD